MKLLIAYATTEGQTRKIARHVMHRIAEAGHAVELMALSDAGETPIEHYDGLILAASLHVGHFQRALTEFATCEAWRLNEMPTLLLSVSLAAAGHEAEDWRQLDHIVADLVEATGWTPGQVEQVAGAYTPSRYDPFRRFVMRRILATKDPEADPAVDREYTDWAALDAATDAWLESIGR